MHVYNNLIFVGNNGAILPTLIENNLNILDISHNLFYDSNRISIDNDLLNNSLCLDPELFNSNPTGDNNPLMYQLKSTSPAINAGRLINGSQNTLDYLFNNGGQDYFGNPVSSSNPPSIGAYNGPFLGSYYVKNEKSVIACPSVTKDKLKLITPNYNESIKTIIFDIKGEYISTQIGDNISLKDFRKGIYILNVTYASKIERLKVVKL